MKKILFVIPSKSIGGTNSSLSSIISQISGCCQVDVLLMTSQGNGKYEYLQSAIVSRLTEAYFTNLENLSGITKYLSIIVKLLKRISIFLSIPLENLIYKCVAYSIQSKNNYDIVVGFSEGKSMKLASEFSAPLKYTWIHCEYDRAVPLNIDELSYYNKFNQIVCVSKFTKDLFVKRYPSLVNNTVCIYNLLDVDRILSLANESIDDIRFQKNSYIIISVGRMDPVKGFAKIPQLAQQLIQKQMRFTWYIIGGPVNDEYKLIQGEIDKYDVAKYVILLGSKSNPYPYFKCADLYVSTSLSEACPMVFNEAKLLGLPIVSTNYGSAYEFIKDHNMISSVDKLSEIIYFNYIKLSYKSTDYEEHEISSSDMQERDKLMKLFSL